MATSPNSQHSTETQLVDYMLVLLDDHVKQEDAIHSGPTFGEYRSGVAVQLKSIKNEFKGALKSALATNCQKKKEERLSRQEVKANVMRALRGKAQREWEAKNADAESRHIRPDELQTPFDVAVSRLLSEIKIEGATYDYVRECLVEWKAGLVNRTEFVKEVHRLNEAHYTNRLAEFVQKRCPVGAARSSQNNESRTSVSEVAESKRVAITGAEGNRGKKPTGKKRGPKDSPSVIAADKRIFEAWNTENHRTYDDLARAAQHGEVTENDVRNVKLAIDRHRHRMKKANRRRPPRAGTISAGK